MFAHIYPVPKKRQAYYGGATVQLIVTATPRLSEGEITTNYYLTKKEAKNAAKTMGAQAWNYLP